MKHTIHLKRSLTIVLLCFGFGLYSQQGVQVVGSTTARLSSFEFPEGLYQSFEDFLEGKPTKKEALSMKVKEGSNAHRFYYTKTKKKVRRVFAISHQGNLYVRIRSMVKEFDSKSKWQSPDSGVNYYLKASELGGYLFFENYFTSLAVSLPGAFGAGVIGGVIGGGIISGLIIAELMSSAISLPARRKKGVIFDSQTKKFVIFKNFKFFKKFIKERHPSYSSLVKSLSEDKEFSKRKEIERVKDVLGRITG